MRNYFYGFFIGFGMFALMGFTNQISNTFNKQSYLSEINNIYNTLQSKQFTILTDTPVPANMMEREFVLVSQNGAETLFTKINGSTYTITLGRN